jgi:hypothetical protein
VWHSIHDKLPAHKGEVVLWVNAYDSDDGYYPDNTVIGYYYGYDGQWVYVCFPNGSIKIPVAEFTHWKELPEDLPKLPSK